MDLSWMAWTWQTASFFGFIAAALVCMTVWEFARPGGAPRHGILGLDTTRGDRLFVSLLTGAYIHLGWLALARKRTSLGRKFAFDYRRFGDFSLGLTKG